MRVHLSAQFCASLIVSPSAPIRNVPYTATSRGGAVEEDSDEYEGTSTSRGSGASEGAGAEAGRRSEDAGVELSASEETVAAISRGRSQRAAAAQRRQKFESGEAREIPAEGAAVDPGEVFGNGTGAVWTNAGSGKRPRRSLGACASVWRFALLQPVLRKRKGGWSATTGYIKIAW